MSFGSVGMQAHHASKSVIMWCSMQKLLQLVVVLVLLQQKQYVQFLVSACC